MFDIGLKSQAFLLFSLFFLLFSLFFLLFMGSIKAITSICAKDSVYFTQKTYFFYFTLSLLQNTHINLSIIHTFLLK